MSPVNWPVNPRPGQKEVAEQLAELLEGKRVLFSAPTGWGKTHALIAALVESEKLPALWLTRSLTVGQRVRSDALLWKLRVFVAAGREKTCPLASELDEAIHDFCRYYKYKCPYFALPHTPTETRAYTYSELVEEGKRFKWCPYYAQDLIDADMVVQNYFKYARRAVRAIIVDEAHNLLIPAEKHFTLSKLAEAVATLRRYADDKLLRSAENLLHYALVRDGALDATLFFTEEQRSELRRIYLQALEEGNHRVKPLVDIVDAAAYVEGEKITLFKPQLVPPYRPAVFVSATPPPSARELFRVEEVVRVPWTIKPRATIVSDVTTKYGEFSSEVATRYKKLLVEVTRKFKRVLVFAASERIASTLKEWVTYYEAEVSPDWEGALLLRARGRFSEGVDLPAECVVIAGAPYLPPEVSDRLAKHARASGVPDPMKAAIDVPMLTTVLQCIGRAWRNPEKPPFVVLADWRFERYVKDLQDFLEFEA